MALRYLRLLAKALVSAGLLYLLGREIDPSAFLEIAGRVRIPFLLLILSVMLGAVLLSCYKWQALLRAEGVRCPLTVLCRYYLIGIFSNNFLPTSIGGDVTRIYLLGRRLNRSGAALSSVAAERFSGVAALMALGWFGTLWTSVVPGAGAIFASLAILAALALWSGSLATRWLPARLARPMESLYASFRLYCCRRKTLWILVWTSLLYQSLMVLIHYLGTRALSLPVGIAELLVIVPLVTLLTLLPFSLNGLGVREGGFVLLLAQAGVPAAGALALSLLVFGLALCFSLAGGVALLAEGGSRAGEAQE